MPRPAGLGWWVAFEASLAPGPKADDLALAADRCKRTGATWVALRAGQDGLNDGAFDEASCAAFATVGVDVYPWFFVDPGHAQSIVNACAKIKPWSGVRGVILNAEFRYQTATALEAKSLVAAIRDLGFDFVAHAPPDYLGAGRASVPFVALDEVCDAIMPQVYAWEHNDAGHVAHLKKVLELYEKSGFDLSRVWPIVCSYRPKTRGFDKNGHPIPTPPMADEADRVASDLVDGLDLIRACPAPSIYSLDAVSWIGGSRDRVIASLEARSATLAPDDPCDPRNADNWASSILCEAAPDTTPGGELPTTPQSPVARKKSGEFAAVAPPNEETEK